MTEICFKGVIARSFSDEAISKLSIATQFLQVTWNECIKISNCRRLKPAATGSDNILLMG
jgi:hypothetical protein